MSDVDVLSEALLQARLRGDAAALFAPPAPFHISFPAGPTRVHFAVDERLLVHVEGFTEPFALEPSDFVLVADGVAHSIATPGAMAVARPLTTADQASVLPGGHAWVTGRFRVEDRIAGPLQSALPAAIHVSASKRGSEWQRLSLRLLLDEIGPGRPGAWIMISRILDLVFIHALREWSSSDRVEPGWLAMALDERLAPALSAIHRHPAHPWTVDELAALTSQSRSAFAHRFRALVGQSPVAYLGEQRMRSAARLLESTTQSVGEVAGAVGFTSEAAFSRAFRRRFGSPPLAWRRARGEADPAPRSAPL